MNRVAEEHQQLWILPASPVIWAAHFLLCYVTATVWCAKGPGPEASLWTVRMAIAAYTAVALPAIGVVGWTGWSAHRFGRETAPHDFDSPEDRYRFIGLATLLLSSLSALAVCYAALVALFIETCQ